MQRASLVGALAILAVAILVAGGARTFSGQRAGPGIETVNGYQVTNVKYWMSDGATVRSVDFDLDAPARKVTARIVSGGPWYPCHEKGESSWSCPVDPAHPVEMDDTDTFQVRAD
jgi:hypothetical protein